LEVVAWLAWPAIAKPATRRRNKALARMAEFEGKIAAHDVANSAPVVDPASLATLAADLNTVWTVTRPVRG
jgi:hypothetical protein